MTRRRTGKVAEDIFAATAGRRGFPRSGERPAGETAKRIAPAIVLGRDWTTLRFEVLGYDLVLALRPRSRHPLLDRLRGFILGS